MRGYASSLRFQLQCLVFLAMVPVLGLTLYNAAEQRRLATEEVQQNMLRLARLAASQQGQLIEGTRQFLTVLAGLPAIDHRDPASCNTLLAGFLRHHPHYANFGVIEPDGLIVCSALPMTESVNASQRAYFQRAMATQRFSIGNHQIGSITKKATVNFGYPLLDDAGQVRAVLFAALDLQWLNHLSIDADLPKGGTLLIVDSHGRILARYPKGQRWIGQSLPETPLVKAILQGDREGTLRTLGLDGIERLYGFAATGANLEESLYVGIGVPTTAAFAGANQALGRNLTWLGILALLIVVATSLFGESVILRPVRALMRAVKQLGAGDRRARTGLSAGPGELHQLAQAFDGMADSLQEAQDHLVQSEKLSAIGQLSAGVAHELKNPLAVVLQGITYVQRQASNADAHMVEVLGIMDSAVTRANGIVQGLLDFARPTALALVPSGINAVIEESLALVGKQFSLEKITVIKELAADLPQVLLDQGKMQQVFINLMANAIQAMPEDGQLTLRTTLGEAQPGQPGVGRRATDGFRAGDRMLICEIQDSGQGIPADKLGKIFEPFFTTKPKGEGTGLGLAIVRSLVEAHRGRIDVRSQRGQGTTFTLTLPAIRG